MTNDQDALEELLKKVTRNHSTQVQIKIFNYPSELEPTNSIVYKINQTPPPLGCMQNPIIIPDDSEGSSSQNPISIPDDPRSECMEEENEHVSTWEGGVHSYAFALRRNERGKWVAGDLMLTAAQTPARIYGPLDASASLFEHSYP